MDNNFYSDNPVASAADDKFQRYNFSKRIAETIINRKSKDCIVVGIYGSWGEGKTSVLNFIDAKLKEDKNTIVIKFNPWRYQDENILLIHFFNKLAAGIGTQLKNTREKFGKFLSKYAKIVSVDIPGVGNVGDSFKAVGDVLVPDVEELKERLNEIIKSSGKRIVVIIDDIDRLDKNEIHAIFRLVKLTADFCNTTYILSFDEKMVAAAIGDRFAGGGVVAGQNFLEKIIQVPLRIPIVKKEIIETFCIEQIKEIWKANDIYLEDYQEDKFRRAFVNAVLPKLSTPRLASRYSNTLSFSVPLLKGEVDIVDLMLIEAVKIFYPDYYNFIRFNPLVFTDQFYGLEDDEGKQFVDRMFADFALDLDEIQEKGIRYLIGTIFPLSNYNPERKSTNYHSGDFYGGKYIASPHYFERYFTYSVIDGDLSDVEATSLVKSLPGISIAEQEKKIFEISNRFSISLFFRKVKSDLTIFSLEEIISFSKLLSRISTRLSHEFEEGNWISNAPFTEAVNLIDSFAIITDDRTFLNRLVREVILSAGDIVFALDFRDVILESFAKSRIREPFTALEVQDLGLSIIQRMLQLAGSDSIFKVFSKLVAEELLKVWADVNVSGRNKYLDVLLHSSGIDFIDIIRIAIPWSGKSIKPFIRDLNLDRYEVLISWVDKDKLKERIFKEFSQEELKTKVIWNLQDADQTDLNYALQFMYYYDGNQPPTIPRVKGNIKK